TDSSAHPVHSITNSKTRLVMALMGMRITSLPLFANLHYNSGVVTFLLRILVFTMRTYGSRVCETRA
ncbi:unnamed protein product, partial [Amoebophrya sp. A120]